MEYNEDFLNFSPEYLTGVIKRIKTYFSFNKKTVFILNIGNQNITCSGYIMHGKIEKNLPIRIYGHYEYTGAGRIYIFDKYEYYCNSQAEIISLLTSGICKKLSYNEAVDVSEKLDLYIKSINNGNLFDLFLDDYKISELCLAIPELLEYKDELNKNARNINEHKFLFQLLLNNGGDFILFERLLRKEVHTADELKKDCYKLCYSAGADFFICDSIAKSLGYDLYDKKRIQGILVYAMNKIENDGDSYATLTMLEKKCDILQSDTAFKESLSFIYIASFLLDHPDIRVVFTKDNNCLIYFRYIYRQECNAAADIARLLRSSTVLPFEEDYIKILERELNITYAPKQLEAFSLLKTTGIKVIKGGPGTGKTTLTNGLIRFYKHCNPEKKVQLCSPTGRAAQKQAESTGMDAKTFHRLLEFLPYDGGICKYNFTSPYDADFFIIDETSMADLHSVSLLLNAIKNNSLVIFIGDVDQLPSVGPGNVLYDLIQCENIEVCHLDTVFRQSEESSIISNAYKINKGNKDLTEDEHFHLLHAEDEYVALSYIDRYVKNKSQFFSPTLHGVLGTSFLNEYIQRQIFSTEDRIPGKYLSFGDYNFYLDDKVMAVRNNYQKSYFNGSIGKITEIIATGIEVTFDNIRPVFIPLKDLLDFVPAYAISIHKSQGSEYPEVVIILSETDCNMLTKKILYTAVTRAKEKVTIIEVGHALEKCFANMGAQRKRCSYLTQRICQLLN